MHEESIHTIWERLRNHPDYAGGAYWTREDVANALLDAEASAGLVAAVSEDMLAQSAKTLSSYIFDSSYDWAMAIRDNVSPSAEFLSRYDSEQDE